MLSLWDINNIIWFKVTKSWIWPEMDFNWTNLIKLFWVWFIDIVLIVQMSFLNEGVNFWRNVRELYRQRSLSGGLTSAPHDKQCWKFELSENWNVLAVMNTSEKQSTHLTVTRWRADLSVGYPVPTERAIDVLLWNPCPLSFPVIDAYLQLFVL